MKLSKHIIGLLLPLIVLGCTKMKNGQKKNKRDTSKKDWALVIHGGAGAISKDRPDSVKKAYRADLDHALSIGEQMLKDGKSSVDVVEQVIKYFENNPRFNAGKGAVFTHEGGHELDAAIMIGNTRQAGSITGIKTIKHPISLARLVMEKSKHVMFAGEGAEEYAAQFDLQHVNQDYFYTEKRYKSWKRAIKQDENNEQSMLIQPESKSTKTENHKLGTVGCVVIDQDGQLVAGTSTGGMTNKKFGRVGDVPIVGGGTYASDEVAVSMTGWGEKIMRAVSGNTVSSYIKYKPATLQEAGDYLINDVLDKGDAGMIAVDKYGNTYMNMNTKGMFRGTSDSEGNRKVAIWEE